MLQFVGLTEHPARYVEGGSLFDNPSATPGSTAITVAVITAAATLLGAAIAWLKDRNKVARRIQILDEATKFVGFWQSVYEAQKEIARDDQRAALIADFESRLSAAKLLVESKGTYVPLRQQQHEHIIKTSRSAGAALAFVSGVIWLTLKNSSASFSPAYRLSILSSDAKLFWFAVFVIYVSIVYEFIIWLIHEHKPKG